MGKEINVVVWSGGMDSTLVLDQLCSPDMNQYVWAYAVNWDMLDNLKVRKEKEARKNYLSYAKKRGYKISYRTIAVTANMGADDLGPAQALAWFSYVLPYLPKNSVLHLGYHSADGFLKYIPLFEKYVKTAAIISGRKIKLSYPLQYKTKCEILEKFKTRQIPMSCFWTCENPNKNLSTGGRCGKCIPCITLKTAHYESRLRKASRNKKGSR